MKSTQRIKIAIIASFITLVAVTGTPALGQQYIMEKMLEEQIEKKMLAEQIEEKKMHQNNIQQKVVRSRNVEAKKPHPIRIDPRVTPEYWGIKQGTLI